MIRKRNVAVLTLLLLAGCADSPLSPSDWEREVLRRQAEHERVVLESSQSVAQGSERLVAADTQARQELIALQQELRADQAQLRDQHTTLEVERKNLALARQRDYLLAGAITAAVLLLACLAPLVLAGQALWHKPRDNQDLSSQTEVLIQLLQAPCASGLASPPVTTPPSLLRAPMDDNIHSNG